MERAPAGANGTGLFRRTDEEMVEDRVSDITATARMTAVLSDPEAVFSRSQVAWLMAQAMRWGAEAAADEISELNLAAIERAVFGARQWPGMGVPEMFSGRATADDLARRKRRAEADAGTLVIDSPVRTVPLTAGQRLGTADVKVVRTRDGLVWRTAGEGTVPVGEPVDPDVEWPDVAEVPA